MSLPSVVITELDGQIGALPSGQKILAMIGVSDAGTVNSPAAFGRKKDVISAFGNGPLVEEACHFIEITKLPVLCVKTGATVAATNDAIDVTAKTGTSAVTVSGLANDDFDVSLTVVAGGTIGVAGITFTYSFDKDRTQSAVTALGTAALFAFPSAGTLAFNFAAGTLVAGDVIRIRTHAPNWNASELSAAVSALAASSLAWEICDVVGPIDGTAYDTLGTLFAGLPEKDWIGACRMPNAGESEAAYLTAMSAIFSARSTTVGMLCYGAAKTVSGVTFRQYRRPSRTTIATRAASVSEEIDTAAVDLGTLPGIDIRTPGGNPDPDCHDEAVNPGADDARFTVLRTVDGIPGVYVNNPRVHSAPGSDFEFFQHRRVMIIAKEAIRLYFLRRLHVPIRVDKTTGFILEEEALEIESGAKAVLRSVLLSKPKASAIDFELSRTDNLLVTKKLNGQARITPLAYPKEIDVAIGFFNPSLQVLKV
jgi:hypothetical protein